MRAKKLLALGRDYGLMTIGAVAVGVALNLFFIPNNVIAGGVMGLAQIAQTLFGTPVGVVTLAINLPLFVLGWFFLGGFKFAARTVYATVVLSVTIDLSAPWLTPYVVQDPLLYVFYGAILEGVGVGLVFRAGGTTGGIDILAAILQRWRGVRPGQGLLALSAVIFAIAIGVYGAVPVLYALMMAYISARAIDLVIEGLTSYARAATIISEQPDAIKEAVFEKLNRGLTVLEGEGGYQGANRRVLYCVVTRNEIVTLKRLISQIDPRAFVVITDTNEVLGEGFELLE